MEKAERLEGITYHNHDRTGEVYQMEGPAWESDMVGFRNYMDQRNGIDIFGKLTRAMVLDSVGVAGRHCYQSTVTYSGTDVNLALVPGIVNMKSDTLCVLNLNDYYTGFMTHDHQAEDTTLLAMALIVPTGYLKTYGETKESGDGITQTYYAVLDAQPDQPVPYRFYALWEKEDPRWASLEDVTDFLKAEADRRAQSVMFEIRP